MALGGAEERPVSRLRRKRENVGVGCRRGGSTILGGQGVEEMDNGAEIAGATKGGEGGAPSSGWKGVRGVEAPRRVPEIEGEGGALKLEVSAHGGGDTVGGEKVGVEV